jgi:3-dehydroquinate dehydratase-2|tara:strand:+ start:4367 stop:4807 length:441 start_codon:yes stop_codon:yes gene_type:complete
MNILLINGPNLNLLGTREKELYGSKSLEDIQQDLVVLANEHQCNLFTFQSNAEHEIIDSIHGAVEAKIDFVIINPAAYTHTSIAIRDAFLGVNIPFYEVHLSEIQTREKYRHFSYLSDIAEEVITGLGAKGYEEAMLKGIQKYRSK